MPDNIFDDYPSTGGDGEKEYHLSKDKSIYQTEKNEFQQYEKPEPDVKYGIGASGNVTTPRKSAGGGSSAPFIHPFKIESAADPDTNVTKTRVYRGNVFARIDTFLLAQRIIETSVASYATSDPPTGPNTSTKDLGSFTLTGLTANLPEHTHEAKNSGEDGLLMPDHKHLPRDSPSEDGLVAEAKSGTGSGGITTGTTGGTGAGEHTHSGFTGGPVTGSGGSYGDAHTHGYTISGGGHNHEYNKDDHSHKVVGETGSVKDYSTGDPEKKHILGSTGNVSGSESTPIVISGTVSTSSSSTSHSHKVPAISNATTTEHKFIEVAGQDFPDDNDKATDWTGVFNKSVLADDGTSTIFDYHESSSSTGAFYVKWVVTINESANVSSIVGSIHRTGLGAAAPTNINFGSLTPPEAGKLTRAEAGRIGTFYQKIGEAHSTHVKQEQFSNINWSMTVLPEVNP